MQIKTSSNGKKIVKMSKAEWIRIGEQAGFTEEPEGKRINQLNKLESQKFLGKLFDFKTKIKNVTQKDSNHSILNYLKSEKFSPEIKSSARDLYLFMIYTLGLKETSLYLFIEDLEKYVTQNLSKNI